METVGVADAVLVLVADTDAVEVDDGVALRVFVDDSVAVFLVEAAAVDVVDGVTVALFLDGMVGFLVGVTDGDVVVVPVSRQSC